jgi:hypothetical protein
MGRDPRHDGGPALVLQAQALDLTGYRIPFSTNVERVALAAGHKGLTVEWVDVDPADRSPVEAASGQALVPARRGSSTGSRRDSRSRRSIRANPRSARR